MKVTFWGQAGLLFESRGIKIMIDPYFSNSCDTKIIPEIYKEIEL